MKKRGVKAIKSFVTCDIESRFPFSSDHFSRAVCLLVCSAHQQLVVVDTTKLSSINNNDNIYPYRYKKSASFVGAVSSSSVLLLSRRVAQSLLYYNPVTLPYCRQTCRQTSNPYTYCNKHLGLYRKH